MWTLLPKFGLIKVLMLLCVLVLSALLVGVTDGVHGLGQLLSSDQFTVLSKNLFWITVIYVGVIYVLAEYVWLWLWKIPGLGNLLNTQVCPNLNGVWQGDTLSTYTNEQGERIKTPIELTIKASFLKFEIALKSVDGYQESDVILCNITKDEVGKFCLVYMFKSKVANPKATDSTGFEGAAKLYIKFDTRKQIELEGTYWTNRQWQQGRQTAGHIRLTKKEP